MRKQLEAGQETTIYLLIKYLLMKWTLSIVNRLSFSSKNKLAHIIISERPTRRTVDDLLHLAVQGHRWAGRVSITLVRDLYPRNRPRVICPPILSDRERFKRRLIAIAAVFDKRSDKKNMTVGAQVGTLRMDSSRVTRAQQAARVRFEERGEMWG